MILLWGWSESKNTVKVCLFSSLQINFLYKKTNDDLFHIFALKVSACYEYMPSAQKSVLCEQNHRETALCTSASVWHLWPPSCFFRRSKRWKSLSVKISIAWQMAALSLKFGWECPNIHHIVLTWHQVTLIFSVLWLSILEATDAKMMWNCKMFHSGFVCKAQNLCWSHAFTDGTLWQMPEPSEWLYGKVSHCSIFLCEMSFWIKGCWMCAFYFLTNLHMLLLFE